MFNKENQDFVSKKKEELNKKNIEVKNKFKEISNLVNKKTFILNKESKENGELYGSIKPKEISNVIKEKLKQFILKIKDKVGDVNARIFVDSAPILERAWAKKSGLGWVGKNTNLISKKVGSFFFLAEIILDLDLVYDSEVTDHCGSCTACIDSCPTDAIYEPYKLDATKCISYLTIELKDKISNEFKGQLNDWIFGCDICQDVCPWNKFSINHEEPLFNPRSEILEYSKNQWKELTNEIFDSIFKLSPVKRTKFKGLKIILSAILIIFFLIKFFFI